MHRYQIRLSSITRWSLLAAIVLPAGCRNDPPPSLGDRGLGADGGPLPSIAMEVVHSGLDSPVDLQVIPQDASGRLFIVEQLGRIRIGTNGVLQNVEESFLNIESLVDSAGFELGLLGLAFHPDYQTNGRFFVNYTAANPARTIVAEYRVSNDARRADPQSARVLLEIDQPFENHNGGQLQFGPDGMLYVGMGDGGSACDPSDRAQDVESLLGKILRLDVDNEASMIPPDNPFVGVSGAAEEIWATGLRNPWRFNFDPSTNLIYIADVGQNEREEINILEFDGTISPDFGWRTFEGTLTPPLSCSTSTFDTSDALLPAFEYTHAQGCSITGGYVYRGAAIPSLDGVYLYSDFCTAFVGGIRYEGGEVVAADVLSDANGPLGEQLEGPTSFGRDNAGEIYLLDRGGRVFKFVPGD